MPLDEELIEQAEAARRALPAVTVPEAVVEALCQTSLALGVGSPRATLFAVRTARVLAAYHALRHESVAVYRGMEWLRRNQNADGGWGGGRGTPSSIEETALAVEALLSSDPNDSSVHNGLH